MFEMAIWDRLSECIFGNFEIARVKQGQLQNIQKSRGLFIPKIARTCSYWLQTKPTNTLY